MEKKLLKLPLAVIGPMDVARLLHETENLDEFFRQTTIRKGGAPQSPPRYSKLLDELVVTNNMNLLQEKDREILLDQLSKVLKRAPILHMSFSVDPPGSYMQKIVFWLRENINKMTLVRVGLQPNIGAGCIVRTNNKSFDFSLRRFFDNKQDFFLKELHKAVAEDDQPENSSPQGTVKTSLPIDETAQSTVKTATNIEIVVPEAIAQPPQQTKGTEE